MSATPRPAMAADQSTTLAGRVDRDAFNRLRALSLQLMAQLQALVGGPLERATPATPTLHEARDEVDPREAQWERRFADKVQALTAQQSKYEALRRRQEEQASLYLAEIEQLRTRVVELVQRVENIGSSPRARHHRRYTVHSSHVFVDALLTQRADHAITRELVMDAPLFTRTHYQPVFKPHPDSKYQLTEFLALHDRNFVRAIYLAILRREPDLDGGAHYLALVRAGEDKALLIDQMLRSDEARQHRTVVQGLDSHLRVVRWCDKRFIGRAVEAVLFLSGIRGHLRDLRVLENHVIRIAEEAQVLHEANLNKLRAVSK